MARITREMIQLVPRDQDIVSYSVGCDSGGRGALVKFVMANGGNRVFFLPPAVAFHIRDSLRAAFAQLGLEDNRRRTDLPEIRKFLDLQPDLTDDDWDGKKDGISRVAVSCEVHAFRDATALAFQVTDDIFGIVRLPMVIAHYLSGYFDDMEAKGALIDIRKTPPASGSRN